MTFEPIWGGIIAWYLFLAGLGGGAFVTSAFLHKFHPEAKKMRIAGHIIAPVVIAIGLILLIFDAEAGLLNPWRFIFLIMNLKSVMMWGVVFLVCFTLVSLIVVVLDWKKIETPAVLEIFGVIFAVCVAMYTGALLGVCKTFPLWNTAILPILFLVSAMSAGAASVLLVGALFFGDEFNKIVTLKKAHFILPLAEILLLAALLFITSYTSPAGLASVMSLLTGKWAAFFWIGLAFIGLIIPAVIDAWMLFFTSEEFEESRKAQLIAVGCSAGVLIGGYLLRYLVVVAALPVTYVL